jgi:hypothetical protein
LAPGKADKVAVIRAAVAFTAAVTKTALPLGAAFDLVAAAAGLVDRKAAEWQTRLLAAVERWAKQQGADLDALGGLPSDWQARLQSALADLEEAQLSGVDDSSRDAAVRILSESLFTPLIADDAAWDRSRWVAGRLLDDMPALLVAASGSDPGLAALLTVVRSDLAGLLDRLPPDLADRTAVETYLTAVTAELDRDAWTRIAGDRALSLMATARRMTLGDETTATADTDADDLVDRCQRLVVLGGPGSGKSWLAKRSALRAARVALDRLAEGADPADVEIPLFARCSTLFAAGEATLGTWDTLVEAALAAVAHRFGPGRAREALRRRIAERPGRYLVVLDGLDEAESPDRDVLERLAAVGGRTIRLHLTSRPEAPWAQLPLDRENPAHAVATLRPFGPDDVSAVVAAWLADRPTERDRLVALLEQRPDLAELARVPLLCAMYCLLAASNTELPRTRVRLYERVVSRMLRGTWRRHETPTAALAPARQAVRQLAWSGAVPDQAAGVFVWPDVVTDAAALADLPPTALAAVGHVLPPTHTDPDSTTVERRFVHQSIRDHLAAEHLASLPVDEAFAALDARLRWAPREDRVSPATLALHPARNDLLARLTSSVPPAAAALTRLLVATAAETTPADWDDPSATAIDTACARRLAETGTASGWLPPATNGWPAAQPSAASLPDALRHGRVPWEEAEIPAWMALLSLDHRARTDLARQVVDILCSSPDLPLFSLQPSPLVRLVALLFALDASSDQLAAAKRGLDDRLARDPTTDTARAYRTLCGDAAIEPRVIAALCARLGEIGGGALEWFPHHDLVQLAEILQILDADPDALDATADRVIAAMAADDGPLRDPPHSLAHALGRLQPGTDRRAEAIEALLHHTERADSYDVEQIVALAAELVPGPSEAAAVLRRLVGGDLDGDHQEPGRRVVHLLADRCTSAERAAMVDLLAERIATAPLPLLHRYVTYVDAISPAVDARHQVADLVLARAADTPADAIGWVAEAVRTLAPDEERQRLFTTGLGRLASTVDDVELLFEIAKFLSWFETVPETRAAVVERLPGVIDALDQRSRWVPLDALGRLAMSDDQRPAVVEALLRLLERCSTIWVHDVAETIVELDRSDERRGQAVDILVRRLAREAAADPPTLGSFLHGMVTIGAPPAETAQLVDVLVGLFDAGALGLRDIGHLGGLLRQLGLARADRARLAAALLPSVDDLSSYGAATVLDDLATEPGLRAAIAVRLTERLPDRDDDELHQAAEISRFSPDAATRERAIEHLLTRLPGVPGWTVAGAIDALAHLSPNEGQRRRTLQVVTARVGEDGVSLSQLLSALQRLDHDPPVDEARPLRRRVLEIVAGDISEASESVMGSLVALGLDRDDVAWFVEQVPPRSRIAVPHVAERLRPLVTTELWEEIVPLLLG